MTSLRCSALLFAIALTACGNDNPPPPPTPVVPPVAPVGVGVPIAAPGVPVAAPGVPVAQPGVVPVVPVVPPTAVGTVAPPPGNLTSNFGTITVSPGFAPDPISAQGTSGGQFEARNWNAACVGWVSQTPDHILMVGGTFPLLRIMVNAGSNDTTLVVQRPDGQYVCNDDTEATNPVVAASFGPGAHRIWVGSYSQGLTAPYRLGVSANPSSTAAALGAPPGAATAGVGAVAPPGVAGLSIAPGDWTSNFGTITLASGFMPDPHRVTGTSGGGIDAGPISPGCRGWIASRPDHVLSATTAFANLRVMVKSTSDTTLVVQKPDGTWLCNDDTDGRNPVVASPMPAGNYRIWVGAYTQGEQSAYTLGLSEISTVMPSSL